MKLLDTQWRPSCPCLRVKQTDIVRKRPTVRWSEMIRDIVEPSVSERESTETLRERKREKWSKRWSEMIETLLWVSESDETEAKRKIEQKTETERQRDREKNGVCREGFLLLPFND